MYAFALNTQRAVEGARHNGYRQRCLRVLALSRFDRNLLRVLPCCAGLTALGCACSSYSTVKTCYTRSWVCLLRDLSRISFDA